jgi:transposase
MDSSLRRQPFREIIANVGAKAVIPSNRARKVVSPHDAETYKQRNRIERCFNKLKHASQPATTGEPSISTAFVLIAATMAWQM